MSMRICAGVIIPARILCKMRPPGKWLLNQCFHFHGGLLLAGCFIRKCLMDNQTVLDIVLDIIMRMQKNETRVGKCGSDG